MCKRFIVVERTEVARIAVEIAEDLAAHAGELGTLDPLASFRPFLSSPVPDAPGTQREVFPQAVVPLIAPTGLRAQLALADMIWGFEVSWKRGPVFNTRIETALNNPECLWAESFARRRCIVPAWTFYESHATETVCSLRTGKPVKRQYAFERRDHAPLLLAAIHNHGRFSLVTTEPNAVVSPVHDRMPLVLDVNEATSWLCGDYRCLLDRSSVKLSATPEDVHTADTLY